MSFKVVVYLLFGLLLNLVICDPVQYRRINGNNGNAQTHKTSTGENQDNDPDPTKQSSIPNHELNKRSPFLKPLKNVVHHTVGRVADHFREHLGFHRPHPDWRDGHFHPYYHFPSHHDCKDHDDHPPKYPEVKPTYNGEHRIDFKPPFFNLHPHRPYNHRTDENSQDNISGGKEQYIPTNIDRTTKKNILKTPPPLEEDNSNKNNKDVSNKKPQPGEKDKHNPTNFNQTTKKNIPSVYPPFEPDNDNKNDTDYPLSDFERRKYEMNGNKPKIEGENVNHDWMHPEEKEDSVESGEIPPTSLIDIRFLKN